MCTTTRFLYLTNLLGNICEIVTLYVFYMRHKEDSAQKYIQFDFPNVSTEELVAKLIIVTRFAFNFIYNYCGCDDFHKLVSIAFQMSPCKLVWLTKPAATGQCRNIKTCLVLKGNNYVSPIWGEPFSLN